MPARQGKGGPRPKPPEQLSGHRTKREQDQSDPDRLVNAAVAPDLGLGDDPAVVVSDWFEALCCSPQARFFTAADWQRARVTARVLWKFLSADRPNAQLWSGLNAAFDALLCSEDKRRQLRIEVRPEGDGPVVDSSEDEDVAVVRALRGLAA